MRATRVRFEHLREALGIGLARPRLSWMVEDASDGWIQSAYEVEARDDAGASHGPVGGSLPTTPARPVGRPRPALARAAHLHVRVGIRQETRRTGARRRPSRPACSQLVTGRRDSSHPAGTKTRQSISHRRSSGTRSWRPVKSRALGCTSQRSGCTKLRSTAYASAITSWHPAGPATTTACATRPST